MCDTLKQSWESVVDIATRYGLEGLGIESQWGEIFFTYPDLVFPGGKGSQGVMLTTHPFLMLRLRKS